MEIENNSAVYQRYLLLNDKYRRDAESSSITDTAEVIGYNLKAPFKRTVSINNTMKAPFKIGAHKAVSEDYDFPNPGDLLCTSLASCFESSVRIISNKLGIELFKTKITATAKVDVRGTLMIDKSVPVGFQSM